MKRIAVGNDYAAWTGICAVGVAIIGMTFLCELRDISESTFNKPRQPATFSGC